MKKSYLWSFLAIVVATLSLCLSSCRKEAILTINGTDSAE